MHELFKRNHAARRVPNDFGHFEQVLHRIAKQLHQQTLPKRQRLVCKLLHKRSFLNLQIVHWVRNIHWTKWTKPKHVYNVRTVRLRSSVDNPTVDCPVLVCHSAGLRHLHDKLHGYPTWSASLWWLLVQNVQGCALERRNC